MAEFIRSITVPVSATVGTVTLLDSQVEKFWTGVGEPDSNGCRLWLRGTDGDGYGSVSLGRRHLRAHRIAYAASIGSVPEGALVDHICHVTLCCAREHLRLATRKQNGEHRLGAQRNSRSGVRGVVWRADRNKWRATITHNGRRWILGEFVDLADAEAAATRARLRLFTHSDPHLRQEASA